ncbi:MAG: hypothetical protein K940chlam7_01219, partial [Chlamydiae bacterium]|nr:hypothetical protein [Chlamydiota bacterium]
LHPHNRNSSDPANDLKLLKLREFFSAEEKNNRKGSRDYSLRTRFIGSATTGRDAVHRSDINSSDASQHIQVDLRRMAIMLEIQCRPEQVLCPQFAGGTTGQALGVSWLNELRTEAKKRGATQENIKKSMRSIRYEHVQKELFKLNRLELTFKHFVSAIYYNGTSEVTIVSGNRTGRGVTFLPRGYDFPESISFLKEYDLEPNTDHSQPVIGDHKGEKRFTIRRTSDQLGGVKGKPDECDNEKLYLKRLHGKQEAEAETKHLKNALNGDINDIDQMAEFLLSNSEFIENRDNNDSKIIFNPANVITALNFIRSRPGTLNNQAVQRKLQLIIFRSWALQRALRQNPQYFAHFAGDLKNLMSEYKNNDQVFPFLLHIADQISSHTRMALKLLEEKKSQDPYLRAFTSDFLEIERANIGSIIETLQDVADRMPTMGSGGKDSPLYTMYKCLNDKNMDSAVASLRILEHFEYTYPQISANEIEKMTADDIQSTLHSIMLFMNGSRERGVPMMTEQTNLWIQEKFLPAVKKHFHDSPKRLQSIANKWISSLSQQKASLEHNWQITENGFTNGTYTIDLEKFNIKDGSGKSPFALTRIAIPIEIRDNLQFKPLFGNDPRQAEVSIGSHSEEFIYSFHHEGEEYQVVYDKAHASIEVFALFSRDGKTSRYRHERCLEDVSYAQIKEFGIWRDVDNYRKGVLRVSPRAIYDVDFNSKGFLEQISSVEGKIAASPSAKNLHNILSWQHQEHNLFFRNKNNENINEIHMNGVDAKLLKRGSQWQMIKKGLSSSYHWLTDLSSNSLSRGAHACAEQFIQLFGIEHEQFMLRLTNDENYLFLMNPHTCYVDKNTKKLVFEKSPSIKETRNTPTLSVRMDAEGKLSGSPAAFLYLAYVLSAKGNFKAAHSFLERAQNSPFFEEREAETAAFDHVRELIVAQEPETFCAIAFKLKMELALIRLNKSPYGRQWYNPTNTLPFTLDVQRITTLFGKYNNFNKHNTSQQILEYWKENVLLTPEEEQELKVLQDESLQLFLKKYDDKISAELKGKDLVEMEEVKTDGGFSLKEMKKIGKTLPPNFSSILIICATDLRRYSEKTIKNEFLNMNELSAENVVRHFFHYWNLISEGKITPEDARVLMRPINEKEQTAYDLVEHARKTLYAHALLRMNGIKIRESFDMKDIWTRRLIRLPHFDFLPTTIGFTVSRLIAELKMEPMHIGDIIRKINRPMTLMLEALSTVEEPKAEVKRETRKYKKVSDSTSLNAVKEALEDPTNHEVFSTLERELAIEIIKQQTDDLDAPQNLKGLVNFQPGSAVSFQEMHREYNVFRRIKELEGKVEEKQDAAEIKDLSEIPIDAKEMKVLDDIQNGIDTLFQTIPSPEKVDIDQAKKYFTLADEHSNTCGMEDEESRQIIVAIKEKGEELNEVTTSKRELIKGKLQEALTLLSDTTINDQAEELRNAILEEYHTLKRPERGFVTDYERLSHMEKLYKKGLLNGKVEKDMTKFLLLKTASQQIKKAHRELAKLDESASSELWQDLTTQAYSLIKEGLKWKRYLDENGRLKSFKMSSYNLVAEYKDEIIFRPGQLDVFSKLGETYEDWYNLRMGIGKTSHIMPRLPEFLGPCMLVVPEELGEMNLQSFNKKSLEMLGKRALNFQSHIDEPISPAYLAEKYHKLLNSIHNNGYAVTTLEQLADIIQLGFFLNKKLSNLMESALSAGKGPSIAEHFEKAVVVMKQLMWIRKTVTKIRELPHFGDEVDAIYSILNEINRAVGEASPPDANIRNMSRFLVEHVLTSTDDSLLKPFKEMLLNGTAATLSPHEVREYMNNLAAELYESKKFHVLIKEKGVDALRRTDKEQWCNYLVGTMEHYPDGFDPEDFPPEILGPVKKFLTHTFSSVLSMNPGNDMGFSDFNPGIIVPKRNKAEEKGMRFSDRYELVLAQYIGYLNMKQCWSLTDSTTKYLQIALSEFQEKNSKRYLELVEASRTKKMSVNEYLLLPEAWSFRMDILDDVTLEGGRLKTAKTKIVLNVQDIIFKVLAGGVTGTTSLFALPFISKEVQFGKNVSSTRLSEAETILRLSMTLEKGLDTHVEVYEDTNADKYFNETVLRDPNLVGIINEKGSDMEGLSTTDWVAKLRRYEKDHNIVPHNFIFIHPKKRIPYLWTTDAD